MLTYFVMFHTISYISKGLEIISCVLYVFNGEAIMVIKKHFRKKIEEKVNDFINKRMSRFNISTHTQIIKEHNAVIDLKA